ncbi:antibiotic biosynthesis monooxygenase [Vibrio sp. DW001]|uniref:antibiotic biosynthesis monooxygenase family protein n=1 Tax=Vibrio sp. DW001 TaxID=2912315 RepID=UPI0023B059B9|nr:antibiotic biosynthesis monooxygenase [Vibrio sp. DW001]WED27606.1 antibiotic biosynthesis monooxygenase [Vibrio sp. DW001]
MTKTTQSVAVIFEVSPKKAHMQDYLDVAAELKEHLMSMEGFISIERFQSLVDENKLLSLSFWESEEAVKSWREQVEHRQAQKKGYKDYFDDYRIRVASVDRDYTMNEREQAPKDSNNHIENNQ